jgi:hypothetical protein
MARLAVPTHPDRVFKDDQWDGYETASGYRSIADFGYPLVRLHDHEAFAVVLDDDAGDAEQDMFDRIVHLAEPFIAAEVTRIGSVGDLVAIWFYRPPE